jgi:hypothetical protein
MTFILLDYMHFPIAVMQFIHCSASLANNGKSGEMQTVGPLVVIPFPSALNFAHLCGNESSVTNYLPYKNRPVAGSLTKL